MLWVEFERLAHDIMKIVLCTVRLVRYSKRARMFEMKMIEDIVHCT